MRRRTLLAAVGATAAGTAGCAALPLGGDDGEDGDEPTPTPTPDPRWGDDAPCPRFDDRADASVCAGALTVVDHVGDDAVLDPADPVFSPDPDNDAVETLALDLRSHDGEALSFNPNGWVVRRYADGAWTEAATGPPFQPLFVLPAGETFTWSLATEQHPTPAGDGVVPAVADLGTGRYAFSVTVSVGEGWTAGRTVACNALLSVQRG